MSAPGNGSDHTSRRIDPYAFAMETPDDFYARRGGGARVAGGDTGTPPNTSAPTEATPGTPSSGPRVAATESIASRTGALSDEIDFPAFVAGLVHGTFDAMVDASIRQMETFADLVSAVAKDVDHFASDNVTANQARDFLAQRHPSDVALDVSDGAPKLRRRNAPSDNAADDSSPAWLADYGLGGEALTDDLIEEKLVPAAQRSVGANRQQMLATLVLLGMNRINIKDGTISARVLIRAAAHDKADVTYATSQDPGASTWGARGSAVYDQHSTMVSTVGVNVQADSQLKAELFGQVSINFVTETLPLERFVEPARLVLLQRNARPGTAPAELPAAAPAQAPVSQLPAPPPSPTPPPVGPPAARAG